MCRGLATGYNTKTNKMICIGKSNHTRTLGYQEDDCVKIEIIINDSFEKGFEIKLDDGYGEREQTTFSKYITKTGEFTKHFKGILDRWVSENELQIYKWLLKNRTYGVFEKNNNNSCQKAGGDVWNLCQIAGGDIINRAQEAGGDFYNSFQQTGNEWYMGLIKLEKYPNTTELIKKIKDNWDLTIVEALSWCAMHPFKARKIMGKELIKN